MRAGGRNSSRPASLPRCPNKSDQSCPLTINSTESYLDDVKPAHSPHAQRSRVPEALFFIALLLVSAVLLAATDAHAQAPPTSPEELRYYTEKYPPYSYEENGRATGLNVELLRLLWADMGVPQQPIAILPWARGLLMLDRGGAVLFSAAWSEERARKYKFVLPILAYDYVLMAPKSAHIRLDSLPDAGRWRVGALLRDITEDLALKQGIPPECLSRNYSVETNVAMLLRGRVDIVIGEKIALRRALKRSGVAPEDYETIWTLGRREAGFMFSKNVSDDLVVRFQTALNRVRKTQTFRDLVHHFQGTDVDE